MNAGIPVEMIYGLAVVFAVLALIFLSGKGASLFVGHNTLREPAFSEKSCAKRWERAFALLRCSC